MNVRVNQAMLRLLGGDPEYFETSTLPIPEALLERTEQGFKEVDGCVVPMAFGPRSIWSSERPHIDNRDDETGFECLINHVHLDGMVAPDTELAELARLGLDFAFVIRGALTKSRLAGLYAIVVSASEADPELSIGPTCTVRFHRVRAGQSWLADNLESYKHEAIAAADFVISA